LPRIVADIDAAQTPYRLGSLWLVLAHASDPQAEVAPAVVNYQQS
jgi:hypothetical protein